MIIGLIIAIKITQIRARNVEKWESYLSLIEHGFRYYAPKARGSCHHNLILIGEIVVNRVLAEGINNFLIIFRYRVGFPHFRWRIMVNIVMECRFGSGMAELFSTAGQFYKFGWRASPPFSENFQRLAPAGHISLLLENLRGQRK